MAGYSGTPLQKKLGMKPGHRLILSDVLVDNKVCAIDETWSGLRFVYRLTARGVGPSSV